MAIRIVWWRWIGIELQIRIKGIWYRYGINFINPFKSHLKFVYFERGFVANELNDFNEDIIEDTMKEAKNDIGSKAN